MTLFGHDRAIAEFRAALDAGKVHHAWLLTGPPGIGKRSFAEQASLRLLAEAAGPPPALPRLDVPDSHPAAHLFDADSHPDFRRLERLPKDAKEARKSRRERDPDAEKARNIKVDQVRELQPFFGTTASMSNTRAVIIDAVDDMERPAANALLKNLEEPPANSVFFLICHSPGRLLPTIRSRCRTLRFARLNRDAMTSALNVADNSLSPQEIGALIAVSNGSPGQALRYAGLEVDAMENALEILIEQGDQGNQHRAALAKDLGKKAAQARYELFLERAPSVIASHARTLEGSRLAEAVRTWAEASNLAGRAQISALDPSATVFTLAGLVASLHEAAHGQR